ncbi:MAG: OpgC family protein [Gammaproteobacteria bacterium]
MAQSGTTQREIRLDFFRGLAMFIIFIAHTPGNWWAGFIPARFGPSDATEMFVFCSGFASAIAFGGVFVRRGFMLGLSRIAYRCWQIYWAHICLFITTATVCVVGSKYIALKDYVGELNLWPFFNDPMTGLAHLLTFTYVPNYFDILPMYFAVLLAVPLVVALRRIHVGAVAAFSLGLWALNFTLDLRLPAEWWSDREWFFDPMGWQLIFFAGFAFGAGWLEAPAPDRRLVAVALVFVLTLIPVSFWPIWVMVPDGTLKESVGAAWLWGQQKTDFGPLRWLHFLALAYLMHCLFCGNRARALRATWAKPIVAVGQQALATFVTSMILAVIVGMGLDVVGRSALTVAVANVSGFALLILVARLVAYFKSTPWARQSLPD